MFAVACATGSAGGCTNRGAGIRNGFYDDDPFTGKSDEVRDACLFRTFEKTCLMDDPWGCTMHGMSFQYGEGVEADTEVAREFYLRSCALEPDFAACETAREQIDEIDNGGGR
jgi:TPR repeat protein